MSIRQYDDGLEKSCDRVVETGASRVEIPAQVAAHLDDWFGTDRRLAVEALLRHPDVIMTPDALSAMKSCALSFSRTLLQRMADERWDFRRRTLEIDADGVGFAVYELRAAGHYFSAIIRANWDGEEKASRRMDRTADFIASLVTGYAEDELVTRELAAMCVPHWGGRTDSRSFGFTAANRSKRHFDQAVEALTAGRQPDIDELVSWGYLVRNAGYYGNGRAGAMSWIGIPRDHPFSVPYHLDFFLLYMWREVGFDFVEAIAAKRSPLAVPLDGRIRRYLGLGNASGLGMTCALVRWPHWVGSWCLNREIALGYAKTDFAESTAKRVDTLRARLERAIRYYGEVAGPQHGLTGHDEIARDLSRILAEIEALAAGPRSAMSWQSLCERAATDVGRDGLEQLHALLIDLYPECTSRLATLLPDAMRRQRRLIPEMTIGRLRELIFNNYGWALSIDRSEPDRSWHFWYHSEEAGEQRRGERYIDPGVDYETFVDVAGAVQRCRQTMEDEFWSADDVVARFTLAHPEHVYIVSRIQFLENEPYGEIRDNLIDRTFLPIKVIRFFLSNFGFESGTPRGVQWVHGVLLQGAPSPEDIRNGRLSDWTMPSKLEVVRSQ